MKRFEYNKIIFLDFDGVLNSWQEDIYHKRLRKNNFWWRLPARIGIWTWPLVERMQESRFKRWAATWHYYVFNRHSFFCPIACSNLQYILDSVPEVKIVVSSSWRAWGLSFCKRILARNGIDASKVVGMTPNFGENEQGDCRLGYTHRGNQIQAWLNKNSTRRYVILDDCFDMAHLGEYLFQTDQKHGLQLGMAERVIAYLKTGDL